MQTVAIFLAANHLGRVLTYRPGHRAQRPAHQAGWARIWFAPSLPQATMLCCLVAISAALCTAGSVAVAQETSPPAETEAASSQTPEEVLNSKGIRKSGDQLVLADETLLMTRLRDAAKYNQQVVVAKNKLAAVEKKMKAGRDEINHYINQRRIYSEQLTLVTTAAENNRIVGMLQSLEDRIRLIDDQLNKGELTKLHAEARSAYNVARESYITHLLETRTLADRLAKDFLELADNPEVKEALAQLSKASGTELKLTESKSFIASNKALVRLEDVVLSDTIDLREGEGGVFYVSTLINGKHIEELVLDSGASICVLPAALARSIGCQPGPDAQVVQLQIADGSIIEGRMITLPSVRIGKFTVENVECAVMPPSATNASALLGLSYLRHFSFKVDSDIGKLTMNKVETPTRGR